MALNILVVDDSTAVRTVIIKTLRLSGLPLGEIYEAVNGKEAMRVLSEHPIDLAFIDVYMPLMNGEQMIDSVQQNPKTADLSVIVVTADSSETRIEKFQKKCAGFVHKPFLPENLREVVIGILGKSHEQQRREGTLPGSGPDF